MLYIPVNMNESMDIDFLYDDADRYCVEIAGRNDLQNSM